MEIHDNQTENVNQGTDNASDSLSQGQNGRDARDSEGHSPIKDNPSTTSKHHSKKKKNSKKRRKRRRSPSSSSSSARSSSSDTPSEDDAPEVKRFRVISEEEKHKYKLPKSMASFANEHFELYIADKELQSNILQDNPVPDNIDPVKKLNDFAVAILKARRRGSAMS